MLLSPALALSVLAQANLHCNEFETFPYTVASYTHCTVASSLGTLTVCLLVPVAYVFVQPLCLSACLFVFLQCFLA